MLINCIIKLYSTTVALPLVKVIRNLLITRKPPEIFFQGIILLREIKEKICIYGIDLLQTLVRI